MEELERLNNIHPGEILREEFLVPLGMSAYRLAKSIGVPQTRIAEIVHEKRNITADTALRLGKFFNQSPEFWIGLQTEYDLREAQDRIGNALSSIEPLKREREPWEDELEAEERDRLAQSAAA